MPELDGLRAISVLLVVSVHLHDFETVWKWLAGWQGVTVFFVLSGYLITTLSLREERAARGAAFVAGRAFYARRSLRIFPLYYLTLAAYCGLIFGLGLNPEKRFLLSGAMPYYLLYFQEVPFFYGLTGESGIVQHANIPFYQSWSLGIEEKFYLVWPVLAFVSGAAGTCCGCGAAAWPLQSWGSGPDPAVVCPGRVRARRGGPVSVLPDPGRLPAGSAVARPLLVRTTPLPRDAGLTVATLAAVRGLAPGPAAASCLLPDARLPA